MSNVIQFGNDWQGGGWDRALIIGICIWCWCPLRLRCFGKDWHGRGWDRAWVDGCPALCHILSCKYATATSKMISCKMTMSVIQVNYKNYYGVLSSQHCRLTLYQSDSWYRRNTHQHQKVSISCQYQKKDLNNHSDTGQGLSLILSYQYANDSQYVIMLIPMTNH